MSADNPGLVFLFGCIGIAILCIGFACAVRIVVKIAEKAGEGKG